MIRFTVNGRAREVNVEPEMPLLWVLRDELDIKGPKYGCGIAQCGACTVHVDGKAVRSCTMPLSQISAQQKVVTLEGLGTPQKPHPIQRAFIEEQAVQCGYCINGMIMESAAFLKKNKKPTEAQIKQALARNLCRCGTHARIVRARVPRAASDAATLRLYNMVNNSNLTQLLPDPDKLRQIERAKQEAEALEAEAQAEAGDVSGPDSSGT
jgi:nicotinate dehydrogenase subunit A